MAVIGRLYSNGDLNIAGELSETQPVSGMRFNDVGDFLIEDTIDESQNINVEMRQSQYTVLLDGQLSEYASSNNVQDTDSSQAEFQNGTLTDVEADSGDYLRLADTDVLSFDGADDWVDAPTDTFDFAIDASFTFELLINASSLGSFPGGPSVLNANGDVDTRIDSNGDELLFRVYDGSNFVQVGTGSIDDGSWHRVSCVYDKSSTEARVYVDASHISTKSVGPPVLKTGETNALMYRSYRSEYESGILSDVRVWNTVRTQTEIQDNMNKRLNGDETGLVAYYKLDEGTGTTATDSAGSNDGTINGATWISNEPLYFMNANEDNNRLSPQLDLSPVGSVNSSNISWTETLNGQTITIETRVSFDEGSTWTNWSTATNGDSIPNLTQGDDVSNGLLECRQNLSTNNASYTPELHKLDIQIWSTTL